MTDYTIAVLEDSLEILELLTTSPRGLTLAQVAERSGFVKNKVFRILYTLEKHRYVDRDSSGMYRPGLRLLQFTEHVQNHTTLIDVSRPVMDALVQQTRESIFLGVASGAEALCIAARESPQSIRLFAQVGRRAPLRSGGVPKVLFAFMPDAERRRLIERFAADPADPFDPDAMEQLLNQIRAQGYAVVVDELDKDAHSVAAPIRDQRGQVIAAISIAGPTHRFPKETVERYIGLVLEGAATISEALGYRPPLHASNGINGSGRGHAE